MNTPSPKYFCPRCRAGYEADTNFCGRCGADMHRASGLQHALETGGSSARMARPPFEPVSAEDDTGLGAELEESEISQSRDRRASDGRDPWLGTIVDDRYRVVEVIGRGGMGVVYKVEHQRMGKIAAMKVLHHDLAGDREVIRRFRREAEAVSRLNHPNTVQVFDFGMARGALYLVMEYVRGLDVGSLIDRDGPMLFARAAPLLGQICAALSEAHELGVVHRDLKPENILVSRTHGGHDFVKVLDFGLAKLSEREELAEVTGRGSIVGTPYYMAPEQIRGEDIDHRADIYSLGALTYRVLTGEHAFTAKTPVGVLTKHLTETLVPPSKRRPDLGIDPRLDDIVARCLAKKAADRYPSAEDLLGDLEEHYAEVAEDSSTARRKMPTVWRSATGGGPSTTPAHLADEIDFGIDEDLRLRRTDLDRFERSLKRRRFFRVVSLPLLFLGAGAAAAYFMFWLPDQPRSVEEEPNNQLDAATLISAGSEVRGHLGKRISRSEPDRDFYRLAETPDPEGEQQLTAHVEALPNVDMELFLYDKTGSLLGHADEGGVGDDEWIRRLRVDEPIAVLVTEALRDDSALPTENVSDQYTLKVRLSESDPRWEVEPNDSAPDATTLRPGIALSGHLDSRADVDLLRFDGSPGRYRLVLSGAEDVPLTWRAGAGPPREERKSELELERGDILRLERTDQNRPHGEALPGRDAPYTLDLAPVE